MGDAARDGVLEISLAQLTRDPYPVYAALRREPRLTWIPALNMWWATRYEDVREALLNTQDFVTGTEASLLFDIFGAHMLTSEGEAHRRGRAPWLSGTFMGPRLRESAGALVEARVEGLLAGLLGAGAADLRPALAARLPILTMLDLFGLPETAEPDLRAWYDVFEAALSNHQGDEEVRRRAKEAAGAFHAFLQAEIDACRRRPRPGLLQAFLSRPAEERLSDEEIRRNALIIIFGGVSTVEAAILNMLWALCRHPETLERVRARPALLDAAFDETMRWTSPVQSATRHAARTCVFGGATIAEGETLNCMLGSANRDEGAFARADMFDIDRPDARRHLGFATGPHLCLGRHLARLEAVAAVSALLGRTRSLRLSDPETPLVGHEFRQPAALWVEWER
jgi:cytochrome P450